jgi:hypothetical protein
MMLMFGLLVDLHLQLNWRRARQMKSKECNTTSLLQTAGTWESSWPETMWMEVSDGQDAAVEI